MKHGLLYILCAAFAAAGAGYAAEVTVKSPDGRIEAKLEDGKQLSFSITADGKKGQSRDRHVDKQRGIRRGRRNQGVKIKERKYRD